MKTHPLFFNLYTYKALLYVHNSMLYAHRALLYARNSLLHDYKAYEYFYWVISLISPISAYKSYTQRILTHPPKIL